ncbi:MAG: LysR substrate-binding domain-containing protein [Kiloniellales bacterium]
MRYSQVRAFHAVARDGGFSAAADRLGITQPAVSIQVRQLEEGYGLVLFDRSGGQVRLTGAGRGLFDLTSQMFQAEERARDFLAASKALETGSLTLAADGPHVALQVVAAFHGSYPGVRLSVSLGNARTVWNEVLEHRVDAAVLANPADDGRLRVVPLARQDMMVLLVRDHPLGGRPRLTLAELRDQPAILREPGSNTRRILDRALADAGISVRPVLELGSREAMREAVAMGLGIGFLFERECVGDERTLAVPLAGLAASSLDTLVCLKSQSRRRAVAALIETARAVGRANGM